MRLISHLCSQSLSASETSTDGNRSAAADASFELCVDSKWEHYTNTYSCVASHANLYSHLFQSVAQSLGNSDYPHNIFM